MDSIQFAAQLARLRGVGAHIRKAQDNAENLALAAKHLEAAQKGAEELAMWLGAMRDEALRLEAIRNTLKQPRPPAWLDNVEALPITRLMLTKVR